MEILTLKLPDYTKITSVNSTVEYTIVRYMAVNHDLLQSAKEVKSSGMLGRDVGGGAGGFNRPTGCHLQYKRGGHPIKILALKDNYAGITIKELAPAIHPNQSVDSGLPQTSLGITRVKIKGWTIITLPRLYSKVTKIFALIDICSGRMKTRERSKYYKTYSCHVPCQLAWSMMILHNLSSSIITMVRVTENNKGFNTDLPPYLLSIGSGVEGDTVFSFLTF